MNIKYNLKNLILNANINNGYQIAYLDWNTFNYLKNDKHKLIMNDYNAFKENTQSLYIPFSLAHIIDLLNSDETYHQEDLEFISKVTNNIFIANESQCFKNTNAVEIYDLLKKDISMQSEPDLDCLFENIKPQQIDLNKTYKYHPFFELLKENNGVLDKNVFKDFIKKLSNEYSTQKPKEYIKSRNYIRDNFKKIKYPIPDTIKNYIKNQTNFQNKNDLESFKKILDEYLKILGIQFNHLELHEKINHICNILEFHLSYSGKLDNDNKLSNQHNDSYHIYYGLSSKYFVSDDENITKKAKFIFDFLGKEIIIMNYDEFMYYLYNKKFVKTY